MDPRYKKALDAMGDPTPVAGITKNFNGVLFGDYGHGKTVACATLVRKRGLFIYCDQGIESLHNHPDLLSRVDAIPYQGLSQLRAVGDAITEAIPPYDQYDCVFIDTISQVQEDYLDFLNDNYNYSGSSQRDKATPKQGTRGLEVQEILGLPDYHLTRNNMRGPIKALIKAPVDVVFTAHVREPSFLDIQKGKLVRRPSLTDTVFKLIAREATWMGFIERKGEKITIQFKTDPKTVSKSRIKELDNRTIDVDELPKILWNWKDSK